MRLTVLVCTHDRVDLLARTLDFLDRARRPERDAVEILVMANACSDGTHELLRQRSVRTGCLPLRWEAEPTPGKSHALNRAIGLLDADRVAFVDDDHRVDEGYLENVCKAVDAFQDADILCGRILPDWDGTEPAWVHDTSEYRIYPLPVPRYDLGAEPLAAPHVRAIPGGGNLVLRTRLFEAVGGFATDFGPVGHNLGGGEDQEWVKRAIAGGARLQYVPEIVQYHYVDPARLTLGYLLRKAYERSASVVRLSGDGAHRAIVPRYMLRKVAQYLLMSVVSPNRQKRRFHMVRTAASLGEIKGHLQARADRAKTSSSDRG